MFTLPRQNDSYEAVSQGRKSYFPGRNLPEVPFRQYSVDGLVKKEFLPYRSAGPEESVSDEVKLANWGNMQSKMTAQNIDDMACDLMNIKSSIVEEKQKIAIVETKLGLMDHILTDSAEIKEEIAKATDKIE